MTEILALLQHISPLLEKTTFRQMSQVIFGMLVISGRITMLGISRWTEKGGSYRTIQRLYYKVLPWGAIHWLFFRMRFLRIEHEYIGAADEVVVRKAGEETHGKGHFFSGIQQQVISGIAVFLFSVVDTEEEQSYPIQANQIVKSAEEKAASKAKAAAKKVKKMGEKRKRGRPKGSRNKDKQEVVLSPELLRVQKDLQTFLGTVGSILPIKYIAMDGHFGNYPAAYMVRKEDRHLISKMRHDAALYPAFEGEHSGPGRKPIYGKKIDVYQMDPKYLKETTVKDNWRIDIYQGQFYNKEFAFALNVVIILKTNLVTNAQAHAILFSTDLDQEYDKIVKFYKLRFQIEFNFRDAKQYWGLEDFMNVTETAVTNAINFSFFMVNFSGALAQPFRQQNPDFSMLDLKSHYRGYRYAIETLKMLPQKPDAILLADIFQQLTRLGAIHPAFQPADSL